MYELTIRSFSIPYAGGEINLLFPDLMSSITVPTKRMEDAWTAGAMNHNFILPVDRLRKEAEERVQRFRKDG